VANLKRLILRKQTRITFLGRAVVYVGKRPKPRQIAFAQFCIVWALIHLVGGEVRVSSFTPIRGVQPLTPDA